MEESRGPLLARQTQKKSGATSSLPSPSYPRGKTWATPVPLDLPVRPSPKRLLIDA